VNLVLDNDAIKNAVRSTEKLLSYGISVRLVELPVGQDPNSLGFKKITEMISNTTNIDRGDVLKMRLKLL
jgi:hypothetical protein